MNHNFEKQLQQSFHHSDITNCQEHLQKTIAAAKNEFMNRPVKERIRFRTFLVLQIQFIGWKIWTMQGILLVIISTIFTALFQDSFLNNPRYAALLLCCMSVLILMTLLPLMHRSLQYKMHEIEMTTRFSTVRLLAAKLLMIGLGDIFMLNGLFVIATLKTPLQPDSTILYLLFSFLLAGSGGLFLLCHTAADKFSAYFAGFCMLLFLCFVLLNRFYPSFFLQTFSIGWAAVCILLAVSCLFQLRYLLYHSSYAKIQLI